MARLLSVNVGQPREIAWRGKTCLDIRVEGAGGGRRLVRRLSVDGDAQGDLADHGTEHSPCKALMFATAQAVCAKPWPCSWLRLAHGTSKKQARIVQRIQLAVRSVFRIIGPDYSPVG